MKSTSRRPRLRALALGLGLTALLSSGPLQAAVCTSAGTGNWSAIAWSCVPVAPAPVGGDDIIIAGAVTFDLPSFSANTLTVNVAASLTINAGTQLDVTAPGAASITVVSGGLLTVNGTLGPVGAPTAGMNVQAGGAVGTARVNGTLWVASVDLQSGTSGALFDVPPGGTANVTGALTSVGNGYFTVGTAIGLAANLNAGSVSLGFGSASTVGRLSTLDVAGNFALASSADLQLTTSTSRVFIGGSASGTGTFGCASGSTVTYDGGLAGQAVYPTSYGNLVINKSGGTQAFVNGAVVAFNNSLNIQAGSLWDNGAQIAGAFPATIVMGPNTLLTLGSGGVATLFPTSVPAGNITFDPTSTVEYSSGAGTQQISAVPTYANLNVTTRGSGATTKNLPGAQVLNINGNLDISNASGTTTFGMGQDTVHVGLNVTGNGGIGFETTTGALNIGGSFLNTGSFVRDLSTVTYFGQGGPFTVRGGIIYHNLVLQPGAPVLTTFQPGGGNLSVFNAFTLANGVSTVLDLGASNLSVVASAVLNGLITGTAGVSNVNLSGSVSGVAGISGSALNFGTTTIAAGSDITAGGPVTLPASTVTNSGTFRSTNNAGMDGMSGFWIQGPNALLDVNGPLMPTGSLNASAAGNTVRFLGTTIGQTLPTTNYFHIEIAKGLQTAGLGGGISVAGNLIVTSGILNTGQFQIGGNATGILTLAGGAEIVIGNPSVAAGPTFPTNYTAANITLAPTSIVKYIANAAQFINVDVGAGGYGFLLTGTGNTNSLKTAAGAGFLLVQNTLTIGNVVPFTGNPTLSMGGINLTAQDVSGSGDLTFTTGNLTINRDFNNTGVYAAGTGTTTYATATPGQVRGTTYNNLQISGPNKTAAGGFTVNGNLTIGALGGLAGGAFNHFVSGNYTLTGGGTFLPQTSSVFFQGGSPQNVTASPFHNVVFFNTAGTTLTGGIAVSGNVLINATGVVNAGAFNHLVSGNWTNSGTFNPGTSTVTFDGTASRNIGNGPFFNVTFQNAGPFNLTTVTSFLNNVVISATGPATLATGNGFDIGGNWQNNGVFAASDGVANFNGAAPQTIGGTQNTTFSSLRIANPTGVTLNRDVDVQVDLSLFSGILATGPNKVNVPAAATLSRTSGWVFGALSRGFAGPGTDTFWVGTAATLGEVGVTVNAGAGFFTVRSVSGLHPNRTGPNVLSRYWTLTPGGVTSANLVFHYQDTDVTGSELAYVLGRYAPPWTYPPATVDSMFNTATANAVTAFGDFTLGEPASIAGVATQLVLTRAGAGNFTAGTADNLTLTALDASGGVSLSYTGLHNITFAGANPSPNPATPPSVSSSTGTQIAFGTAVPLNFVAGVATVSGANNGVLRLYRTEAVAITATDGTIATAAPLAFNVVHGPLGKFTFALATPQQNGVNFTGPSTLRAEDAFGNTATSFNASVQPVTVTANAPLSGAVSFAGHGANVLNLAGDFAAGIANLQTLQMRYTGLSGTGTFTATQGAVNSASNPVVVNAGVPDHFTVVAAASSQTAGSINLLTITAVDANGNVATSYTGNHNLTFAGANPAPNAGTAPTVNDVFGSPVSFGTATILSFSNGVAQATGFTNGAMTLYRAETAAITATDGSLVTPVPFTVVVSTRPAIRFRFQLTSPQVNGIAFTGVNTLTAEDIYGNTVTTFSAAVDNVTIEPVAPLAGTVSGLGSAGNNVLNQASSFVLGVANLTGSMRFAGSGSGEFSATSLGFASGTSNTISITNGPPTKLAITSVNGGVSPTAGLPFGIVVEAQTAGGLASNVSASTNVSISLFTGTGTLAGTLTGTILAGTSSVAIGGLTYTKAETGVVLQAARTSGDVLASGPSAPFTVVSGALDHFLVEAAGGGNVAPQIAGAPFALRITAFDAYGNVVTSYGGTVLLTSNAALTGAPVSSGAFTNGVLASQNVTITSAQLATTVTATDGAFSGTSNAFVVNPAGVVSFLVEAGSGGSIAPQTAGVAFPIRITARDAFGNTATSFTGTPDLTITAGGLTPPTVVFGAADNGVRTLNVTAATAGSMQSITVSDVPTAGTGTSNPFTVNPAAGGGATNFLVEAGAGGAIAPQRTGVPFAIRITAKTAGGAVDTAFTGVASLTTTAGLVSPSNVTFGAGDTGVKTVNVTVSTAGINQTISATSGAVTGTSNPFTVDPSSWSISVTGLDGGSIGTQVNGVPFDIEIALSDSGAIRRRLLAGGTFEGNIHLSTNQGSISPPVISFVAADNNLKLVSVTVTGGGPLQTITATEPLTGSAGTSATFTVTGGGGGGTAPDLSLTKSHAGTFFVGSPGAYTLTVFNGGNAPTTGPITITDILPAGLSFVSGSGSGFVCSALGQTVTCVSGAPLGIEASVSVTLVVNVGAAAVPQVTNVAGVTTPGDAVPENDGAVDPTNVQDPIPPPAPDFFLTAAPGSVSISPAGTSTVNVTATGINGFIGTVTVNSPTLSGITFSPATFSIPAGTTQVVTLTAAAGTALGQTVLSFSGSAAGIAGTRTATFTLSVTQAPDFALSVAPSQRVLKAGGASATVVVSMQGLNGFTSPVAVVAPQVAGVTFTPSQFSVAPGQDQTVTISAAAAAVPGNRQAVFAGTGPGVSGSRTTTLVLTIDPALDFALSVAPTALSIVAGGAPGSVTVSAQSLDGLSGAIQCTAPVLNGVAFTPASFVLMTGGSQIVQIAASSGAAPGLSQVAFTGVNNATVRTTQLNLTILPPPPTVTLFTATPASINAGQTSTLDWTTLNATSVAISGVPGTLPPTGTTGVTPQATTVYTLTATGPGGTATATVTVNVCTAPAAPINVLVTAAGNPTKPVTATDPLTLSWQPAPGATPVRYEYRINGEAFQSTTATSVGAPPRGNTNPITLFVRAYSCAPEVGPGPEGQSPVYALAAPVADFSAPAVGVVNQPLTLTDTSNPQATSWIWLFDDGTPPATTQTVAKTFTTTGTKTITLVASNGSGSSSKIKTVSIAAAGPVAAESARAFDAGTDERKRLYDVNLSNDLTARLALSSEGTGETAVFLRFLDPSTGEALVERRLVLAPEGESVYLINAFAPQGRYVLEIVPTRPVRATLLLEAARFVDAGDEDAHPRGRR